MKKPWYLRIVKGIGFLVGLCLLPFLGSSGTEKFAEDLGKSLNKKEKVNENSSIGITKGS